MKTFLIFPLAIVAAALASCTYTDWTAGARIAPGSEYGYGTENGDHPPYRSDARTVAMVRARNGYAGAPRFLQYSSRPGGTDSSYYHDTRIQYNRSPYGGGVDTRSYRSVYPSPYVYPGYGYPGYGYPGYGYPYGAPAGVYGRW